MTLKGLELDSKDLDDGAFPLVSVLLPVRDGARHLPAALHSLLIQKGVPFEIIAIDDASQDDTPAILAAFAASHPGVRVLRGDGRGIARALGLGLAAAQGRYIARMDADDIALPGRLAAQALHLERHPGIGVLGTQAHAIDVQGKPLGRVRVPVGVEQVRRALDVSSALIHPSVMMRVDMLRAAGGYRSLFDGAEDYDLWLRLSSVTHLDNLPRPWLLLRRHGGQYSVRRSLRQARLAALALVSQRMRVRLGVDPLEGAASLGGWRERFSSVDAGLAAQIRPLTVSALVDNGGSLRWRGGRLLHAVVRVPPVSDEVGERLALASARHLLQLWRRRRWLESLGLAPGFLRIYGWGLLKGFGRHAAILVMSRSWAGKGRTPEETGKSCIATSDSRSLLL